MLPKFLALAATLLLSIPSAVAVDLVPLPSNNDADLASTLGAMAYLMTTNDPLNAFETNGSNLRSFLEDPNHDPIAIIDLRQDDQYNEGYIKGSLRWPMRDGDQQTHIQRMANTKVRQPDVLYDPTVLEAKYVVFYCQAGQSRSPQIATAYYRYKYRRSEQVVVLLANGFEEFQRDPMNQSLIGRRATFVNPNRISKADPEDDESDDDMDV